MYTKQVLIAWFNYFKQKINILKVGAKKGRQDKMKASGRDGIPVELLQILKRQSCESAALNMSANL